MLSLKTAVSTERVIMGEWQMFVLGFDMGSPWAMTRFSIWPCKMVAEEEVVLDEEIKHLGKQTFPKVFDSDVKVTETE